MDQRIETPGDPPALTVPADLLARLRRAAALEHRPAADLLRDIVERALNERPASGLALPDVSWPPMTQEDRQEIREKIAEGMRSIREGRVVDGETFMAQLDAELAELEKQSPG